MKAKLREWATWVAGREIWPLVVGAILATFTTRWALWGLGLIALLWLVRCVGHGRLTIPTPLDWPACLLLLMVPVTFYATTDVRTTFTGVSRLLAGMGLTYGLANWVRHKSHASLLTLSLIGVGMGLALVAPVTVGWFSRVKSFLIPAHVYDMLPTLVSDTIHPNIMAGMLVMLLPFPLAVLLLSSPVALPSVIGTMPVPLARLLDGHWLRRLWCGLAALLMLAVLVLTKSRGGWMAGATVIFLVLVHRQRHLLWLIPVAVLGAGLLAWLGEVPAMLDMISTSDAVSSWAGRMEIWSRALYMIRDFPFTGIGVGTFPAITNVLYPYFLVGPGTEVPHAHNLLLQVGVDLGLPGLVAYLSILLLVCRSALDNVRFYRQVGDDALAAVAWAGMVSIIAMLMHGMLDAATWIIGRAAFVPWLVMGLVVALHRLAENEDGERVSAIEDD